MMPAAVSFCSAEHDALLLGDELEIQQPVERRLVAHAEVMAR